jgi:hypothetical protein
MAYGCRAQLILYSMGGWYDDLDPADDRHFAHPKYRQPLSATLIPLHSP